MESSFWLSGRVGRYPDCSWLLHPASTGWIGFVPDSVLFQLRYNCGFCAFPRRRPLSGCWPIRFPSPPATEIWSGSLFLFFLQREVDDRPHVPVGFSGSIQPL